MKITIDLDGVCFDFNSAYKDKLIKVTGENRFPTNFEPPCWDWEKFYGYTSQEIADAISLIAKDKLFWRKLKPIPPPEVFTRLNVLSKEHDLYFITNRFGVDCKQQTERALYELGINYPTVVVAADKAPILKAIKADVFADDKLPTMIDVQAKCSIPHLYLIDGTWNRSDRPADLPVAANVKEVLEKAGLW